LLAGTQLNFCISLEARIGVVENQKSTNHAENFRRVITKPPIHMLQGE